VDVLATQESQSVQTLLEVSNIEGVVASALVSMLLQVNLVKPIVDRKIVVVSYDLEPFSLKLIFALSQVDG